MRIVEKSSPFTGETREVAVSENAPRFRLTISCEKLENMALLRNLILEFGLLISEREMTPRQRTLFVKRAPQSWFVVTENSGGDFKRVQDAVPDKPA